jgi:hypothetical protein
LGQHDRNTDAARLNQGDNCMGRLAEAIKSETGRSGGKCVVGLALNELTGDDLDDLVEGLAARPHIVPHVAIQRVLRAEGYTVGDNAVNRHRQGSCSCGPHS